MQKRNPKNYSYDDHSEFPFKLVKLKPVTANTSEAAHRHNFFQLFFFLSDGGNHLIDFKQYACKKNQIHVVNPGSIHQLQQTPKTSGYVILFSRTFFDNNLPNPSYFLYRNDFEKMVQLSQETFSHILHFVEEIANENANKGSYFDKAIQNLLELIVINIQRQINFLAPELSSENDQTFNAFTLNLNRHFTEEHRLTYYAQDLAISMDKLNRVCQEKMNKTASELLHDRILLEARRLLFHSRLSVKEIAFSLGYDDPSYFNRFFKKKVGETPLSFRQSIQEKYHS